MQTNLFDSESIKALRRFKEKICRSGQNGAVVIGMGVSGLGVIRSLGRKNIPVLSLESERGMPEEKTRYCEKAYCPNIKDSSLVDTLLFIADDLPVLPVLFATSDILVNIISENRDSLLKSYRFLLPDKSMVKTLLNKNLFSIYAVKNNFPVPITFTAGGEDEIKEIADKVKYPCIMKPVFRNPEWENKVFQKTFKIFSPEQLISLYLTISGVQKDVIVQEWIPGPDSEIFFCLLYFNKSSEPVAHFEGRKLLQWPPECGSTAVAEEYPCEHVLKESLRLFKAAGFKGLGSVEFKRDIRTGRFVITEPTVGRVNLQSDIACACGIDITYHIYCELSGINPDCKQVKKYSGLKWIEEEHVLYLMMSRNSHRPKIRQFINLFNGRRSYALWSIDDPLPFLSFITGIVSRKIKKSITKPLFFLNIRNITHHHEPSTHKRN